MSLAFVITTINAPTPGVQGIAEKAKEHGQSVIVIGDTKTPTGWTLPGVTYLSLDAQLTLPFRTTARVPERSYTRKLLGYLSAYSAGAHWIRETDDDNAPYLSFFDLPEESIMCRVPISGPKWLNPSPYFTDRFVWPRGFPLRLIQSSLTGSHDIASERLVSGLMVIQGLADGDPDVDAIYRLASSDNSPIRFRRDQPLAIPFGTWTPFNTQVTTWPRELLPLMYLPSTCSFRMTDIWRSYVAQRLMPELGATLVVTAPTVYQDRNEHDLMRDFREEIEGYVGYERFVDVLESTPIGGGFKNLLDDLRLLYSALIDAGFFTSAEMLVLDAWIADMEALGFGVTE